MPVSIVVGGQYGSEGKGKVALDLVRRDPNISIVIRPGGTNSGHTGYSKDGRRFVLRQLPVAAIDGNVSVVLPAGSYIRVPLLLREIAEVGLSPARLVIDPRAHVITDEHISWERDHGLPAAIGSTGSGTGAAVVSRLARLAGNFPPASLASEVPELLPFVSEAVPFLDSTLRGGGRVLIEGTQGFGLSPLHGDAWPKATSRDTTAAAFVSEAGLSPLHVDEVVLVVRSHPIRVAGDSGPMINETTWESIASAAGATSNLQEFTSVTKRLRRVGFFDPEVVTRAISVNSPTAIVLNHIDHVDWAARAELTAKARSFIEQVEKSIQRSITHVGVGPINTIAIRESSDA